MNSFIKFFVGLLAVIVLFAGGFALVNKTEAPSETKTTLGVCSGSECTETTRYNGGLHGQFFSEGGGRITVSTTSATYTLTQAELTNGNIIYVAPVAGAAALSLALPATSTLTSLLPKSGDARKWYIANEHTSAATTTTIIAGTGIELQGDGTGSDVINGGVWGALECYRRATTDLVCIVHEYVAAD